ncbi:hypothetical protein [Peribacillus sp. FSL E2-0159]
MYEMRKKIIIQEINSWKESRMIPEQYCNYLLALSCQGELPPSKSNKTRSKKNVFSGVLIGTLFALIVFLNYFTEIPIRMQMLMTTISMLVFGLAVRRKRQENHFSNGVDGNGAIIAFINCQFGGIHGTRQSEYPLYFLVH